MATYAIGDVQGCYGHLIGVLDLIGFDPANDKLWLTGDLVNRGPQSLEVLRFVKNLGESAVTVLGNHDLHLLGVAAGIREIRKSDSLDEVLNAPDRAELMEWLRFRPLLHSEGRFILVHAGLLPDWTASQAAALASEAEAALRRENWIEVLDGLRSGGNPKWDDALSGIDRLRVMVNAITRMRVISLDGEIDFHFNGPPEKAPEGFIPWSAHPGRKSADKVIVCGHWAAQKLKITPGMIALDHGCVWHGGLAAIRLEDMKLFTFDCGEDQE